jgi:hypothetical protein
MLMVRLANSDNGPNLLKDQICGASTTPADIRAIASSRQDTSTHSLTLDCKLNNDKDAVSHHFDFQRLSLLDWSHSTFSTPV